MNEFDFNVVRKIVSLSKSRDLTFFLAEAHPMSSETAVEGI